MGAWDGAAAVYWSTRGRRWLGFQSSWARRDADWCRSIIKVGSDLFIWVYEYINSVGPCPGDICYHLALDVLIGTFTGCDVWVKVPTLCTYSSHDSY